MGVSERTSHDERHISVLPDTALVQVPVLVDKVLVPVLVHMAQVPAQVPAPVPAHKVPAPVPAQKALTLVHPGTPAVAITTQQTPSHHV